MRDLRLAEEVWEHGSPMRRAEWRAAIDDLRRYAVLGPRFASLYGLVTPAPAAIRLEFLDEDGVVAESFDVPIAVLDPHVKEYLAIIRRLDEGAGHRETSWVEAVDMAKKVVHDSAARTLATTLAGLAADHETYRRIFTLLLALVVDTTELVHVRGHRYGKR
ncbi:MAG: UPF0262 family protein [Polyangiaceae bacterium]